VFAGVMKPSVAVIGEKIDGECTQDNDAGLVVPLPTVHIRGTPSCFFQTATEGHLGSKTDSQRTYACFGSLTQCLSTKVAHQCYGGSLLDSTGQLYPKSGVY